MASDSKTKTTTSSIAPVRAFSDNDDFEDPVVQSLPLTQTKLARSSTTTSTFKPYRLPNGGSSRQMKPLKPSNSAINRPPKNPYQQPLSHGKENLEILTPPVINNQSSLYCSSSSSLDTHYHNDYILGSTIESNHQDELLFPLDLGLDSIESTIDCSFRVDDGGNSQESEETKPKQKEGFTYSSNSIESRLLKASVNCGLSVCENDGTSDEEFQPGTQLNVLLRLCSEVDGQADCSNSTPVHCPLCGNDISDLSDELRQLHTNQCLDKEENPNDVSRLDNVTQIECPGVVLDSSPIKSPGENVTIDVSPVLGWLRSLGLEKYEEAFVREEIDWDSLQWLTEEDLLSIGVTALGPRKKIINSLKELRNEGINTSEKHTDAPTAVVDETDKLVANKLITDYFPGHVAGRQKVCNNTSRGKTTIEKNHSDSGRKSVVVKNHAKNRKIRDVPLWCSIPGTPFRVDAFKFLRRDCSHWFLTHFHIDHYQGLTKSFCHGKIYCSSITAKLVNLKIGIPWDKLQVLPLNQKISIQGIDVTCFDANHCPGSIILLFEPPNGQAVLHTGDFRFSEDMARVFMSQISRVHTLILDTTYCDPQYDFPKQDAVIQFVIEAIQAEAFNPKTLFLIGSYTIGKERLFLEVARVLRKKVYITMAKLRILECLGLSNEDMEWLTTNEQESHIHVVPMWTLASFKRLKHVSNQYQSRFSLVVAISPTGWSFGKGKKKSPGRRWQQGTIIRYEVPYSEHCSFTELREFVKLISAVNIIPSVNNEGPESTNSMLSLLISS